MSEEKLWVAFGVSRKESRKYVLGWSTVRADIRALVFNSTNMKSHDRLLIYACSPSLYEYVEKNATEWWERVIEDGILETVVAGGSHYLIHLVDRPTLAKWPDD